MEQTKTCRKCQQIKPFSSFYKHSVLSDGRENMCKSCRLEKRKGFISHRIDFNNFVTITQKQCWLCLETKAVSEFGIDRSRKDGLNPRCRQCQRVAINKSEKRHPESLRRKWRNRYRKNPDKIKIRNKKNKARRKGAEGSYTQQDIQELFSKQDGKCVFCRISIESGYHIDHIIPISKGGSNYPSNLQLLCATCNLKKGNKLPSELSLIINAFNQSL